MLYTVLALVLFVLLLLAFLGDLLQYMVRIAASIFEQPNLSTHLVSLSMLLNRIGAACGLLLIGFFIDRGVLPAQLITVYCAFSIVLAGLYFLAGTYAYQSMASLRPLVMRYYKIDIKTPTPIEPSATANRPPIDISAIFFVALCGFLLPSVAAAIFPDYRATLLQTGFILNSFATLYSTLKIEKDLAVVLNSNETAKKWLAFTDFMFARSIGSLFTALTLPVILLFL